MSEQLDLFLDVRRKGFKIAFPKLSLPLLIIHSIVLGLECFKVLNEALAITCLDELNQGEGVDWLD